MGDLTTINCIKHIETYVDSSSSKSPAEQDASLDAIAKLLMSDMITLESLVREMDMYLTTTDNIIRARGILLLAELLTRISSKRLENTTIHSLIGFFADRLSDWRALRGALVGCLTLMRRKGDTGAIRSSDASAVAQSFMQNLQVQSLGQHDRKLCFEILECLLDRYPDTVTTMEDEFVYVICEAIDGEKDPQCLLVTFHLVEMVAKLYPESSDSLASYAEDLFNILGSYFPIHFTHPKGEDDVKREEISRALMLAFASTPLFEPFAIPLLLEKLSSSLPSAKIESLKYLSYCTINYGAHRMLKHYESLWSSLKDTVFTSAPSSLTVGQPYQDNKIISEALILLQKLIQQDSQSFPNLILNDMVINYKNYDDITEPDKQRLNAIGRILYISASTSVNFCNAVFQSFFSGLVNGLGLKDDDYEKPKFGYLYICVELLSACRTLVVGPTSVTYLENEIWCTMLRSLCSSLTNSFVKSIKESTRDVDGFIGVRGLQILASFPGSFLPVSKATFENILFELVSNIILKFNSPSLWRFILTMLVEIGSFIEISHDSEKMPSFDVIVVDKIMDLLSSDDSTMPFSLIVEAVSEIGTINLKYMLKIVEKLNKSISTNLQKYWLDGNSNSAERVILVLECYSDNVFPWFQNNGESDNVSTRFALNILDEIENNTLFCDSLNEKKLLEATMNEKKLLEATMNEKKLLETTMNEKELLETTMNEKKLLEATMNTMKHAVASCLEDGQNTVLDKAFSVLSSSKYFQFDELFEFSRKDKWIISLFDSVIISLLPKTPLKNTKTLLNILVRALSNGHTPSAHALGSLFNKMPLKEIDITFNVYVIKLSNGDDDNETRLSDLQVNDVNALVGLAWTGKGLLMRGHEKVKDVIEFFLKCLISNGDFLTSNGSVDSCETVNVMRTVADSFGIIMSDSEACLNRRLHATVRPLYKQRLFNIVMPILLSSIVKSDSPITRAMMHRALAHVISNTPLSAILGEAKKLIPLLIDGLRVLSEDVQNRDIVYNVLLVLSGILTDKNAQEAILDNANVIIRCLNELVFYTHMMLVRETAIQCLMAVSELPYTRIYPFTPKVLQILLRALDDPKRSVRKEAVKCRQAWAAISSRSIYI